MDFNQLFFEHQVELIRAANAHDMQERQGHCDKADRLAYRIARLQHHAHVESIPLMPAATLPHAQL